MRVLVVAEHVRGQLRDVTRELVTAARELDGPVSVAVIARDPSAFDLALDGVDEVIRVRVDAGEFENDVYQHAVEAVIASREPQVVLMGFTVNSIGYGPALAAKLGLGFASDVHGVSVESGAVIATRSFYGGKVHGEVEFPAGRPVVLLARPQTWAPAGTGGSPAVCELDVTPPASRARHVELAELAGDSDAVDITAADFLLSVGRGVGQKEEIPQLAALAEKLGAVLSASRPLVDAGWLTSARQVGQSGRTVKPKVYLALGISGAVQHLAGMKASGTIIAVNTDPEAAIFGVAHYGAVADLFEIAEELDRQS